jgi:YD repeat-containing protein
MAGSIRSHIECVAAVLLTVLGSPVKASGQTVSKPPAAGAACRTYVTADAMSFSTSGGLSGTVRRTCDYKASTNTWTCTLTYSDSQSLKYTSVVTFNFATLADFVGDAPRIVLFASSDWRPAGTTIKTTMPGVASTGTMTYAYDSERRLTRITNQTKGPTGDLSSTMTFSAWDEFGRPTAATDETSRYAYVYNDADRTTTLTNVTSASVITQTFDANGIQIAQTAVGSASRTTSTWTNQSTATVCR